MHHSHDKASALENTGTLRWRGLRLTRLLAAIALAIATNRGGAVQAATIDVPCSATALSSAIATVNTNGEEDLVWLAPGCLYALPTTWTVAYDGGNPVRIYGRGAKLSGGGVRLPLIVSGGAVVFVDKLTVRDGAGSPQGGGIRNLGTLTLTRSTVSGNVATQGYGGGIYNGGVLRIHGSSVSDNRAGAGGGGIDNDGTSRLTVTESSVSGNSAPYGGGTRNQHFATLINTTFHGNDADLGAALLNESSGRAALAQVAVSGNEVSGGGGSSVHNDGVLALHDTILANTNAGNSDCWSGLAIVATGRNLVEDGSCGVAGALSGDPKLGAPFGKPSALPLLAGSPAIDAGSSDGCPGVDQRGVTRPQDGDHDGTAGCDLGAFETKASGACGLLGIEPFLLLPFLRRLARRVRWAFGPRSRPTPLDPLRRTSWLPR